MGLIPLLASASYPATALRVLAEAGVVRFTGPFTLATLGRVLGTWGTGLVGGMRAAAVRFPDSVGLIDDLGELTYREIDERGIATAHEFASMGVSEGDAVAVMCRNHRGLIDATLGAMNLGADVLFLNTAFAAPQLADVISRERPSVVVFDQEFADLVAQAGLTQDRVLAWCEADPGDGVTLESLVASGSRTPLSAPSRPGRAIILTSGTTGTPKGAPRGNSKISAAVALLSRMPLRHGGRTHIAAPLFHTWGWAHLSIAMLLGSTVVVTRKFQPAEMLELLQAQRCDALAVIPVMLQRTLQLPNDVLDDADLTRLRVVASSGSALPGELALAWMDRFGDHLYNIYGSTEVAWVSIATPEDLRAAPTCAGRPPVGTTVRLYDDADQEVEDGAAGRIFVGNSMLFEGYTGGGDKTRIDGLMSSGDVGRFDADGRLFVEGRDDDMIVSGGENVFPQEVEHVLSDHPDVVEAAAIGVSDEEFGQRLRAFVVLKEGAEADASALQDHVRAHLARYKVPRDVVFLAELPRNATGKILKRTLNDPSE